MLAPYRAEGYFPLLPFGSDLTEEEAELIPALERLRKAASRRIRIPSILAAAATQASPDGRESELLARLNLREARNLRERVQRALVLWALRAE